jgi:hypothetical protein
VSAVAPILPMRFISFVERESAWREESRTAATGI